MSIYVRKSWSLFGWKENQINFALLQKMEENRTFYRLLPRWSCRCCGWWRNLWIRFPTLNKKYRIPIYCIIGLFYLFFYLQRHAFTIKLIFTRFWLQIESKYTLVQFIKCREPNWVKDFDEIFGKYNFRISKSWYGLSFFPSLWKTKTTAAGENLWIRVISRLASLIA